MADQNIQQLDWPGNSPDLNPIENLWAILKKKIAQKRPSSQSELHYWIRHIWAQEIQPAVCRRLVLSMPDRIRAVLKAKGWPTKY